MTTEAKKIQSLLSTTKGKKAYYRARKKGYAFILIGNTICKVNDQDGTKVVLKKLGKTRRVVTQTVFHLDEE